jgi:ABC-type sugar transport system permease subunit
VVASRQRRDEAIAGYAFITPLTLLLVIFYFVPLLETAYYSFTSWNPSVGGVSAHFVGFSNYANLDQQDFVGSCINTLIFLAVTVPLSVALGLILALLLHNPIRGRTVYRTLIFTPFVAPVVGSAFIFTYQLSPIGGAVDSGLTALGLAPINFLGQEPWAMASLITFSIWQGAGFDMLIYLAALASVPHLYYEAAYIDGANWAARFRSVTWPLIWPTTTFLLVTGVIGAIQVFTQVYALTQGGPLESTYVIMYWIYEQSFVEFNGGLATAGSMVLFLAGVILTLVQLKLLGRRRVTLLS